MTINKTKSSSYDCINARVLYDYIRDYATKIYFEVEPDEENMNGYVQKVKQFEGLNRTQLKAIAAELETVNKRLAYIIHGRY